TWRPATAAASAPALLESDAVEAVVPDQLPQQSRGEDGDAEEAERPPGRPRRRGLGPAARDDRPDRREEQQAGAAQGQEVTRDDIQHERRVEKDRRVEHARTSWMGAGRAVAAPVARRLNRWDACRPRPWCAADRVSGRNSVCDRPGELVTPPSTSSSRRP